MVIRQWIYYGILSTCALTGVLFLPPPQKSWFLWALLSFGLIWNDKPLDSQVIELAIAGIVAALGCYVATLLAHRMVPLALYLAALGFVFTLLIERYPAYFVSILMPTLLILVAAGIFAPLEAIVRSITFLMAAGVVMIAKLMYWPFYGRARLRIIMDRFFRRLDDLNREIFNCFLQQNYSNHVYLYEHRLFKQKNACRKLLLELYDYTQQLKTSSSAKIKLTELLQVLYTLYEQIIDCAQLRLRVTDFTIFSIAHSELTNISNALSYEFQRLSTFPKLNPEKNSHALEAGIEKLTAQYEHILRVIAREPLAFVLFIGGLKALAKNIQTCQALALEGIGYP